MGEQYLVTERSSESGFLNMAPMDADMQRGRKRRRSPPDLQREDAHLPSDESATFRGRCRHRSTSRLDSSRASSRFRGGSVSPSRRRLMLIANIQRRRDQSPSRSRSPAALDSPKRRRQRTRSHSRDHRNKLTGHAANDQPLSMLRHELLRDDLTRSSKEALLNTQQTG